MTILDAIILGVVQGLTEFLPVSSSGHLILMHQWLGVGLENGLAFDAVLQFATACAVVIYFWRDLCGFVVTFWRWAMRKEVDPMQLRMIAALVVATIPAMLFGLLLESAMETVFRSGLLVAFAMAAGSVIMYTAERWSRVNETAQVPNMRSAFMVGLFQSLAFIPGMSRSGMTISGSMLWGLSREHAARFAFLLAVPILLGSGAKKIVDISTAGISQGELTTLIVGAVVAFVVGFAVIHWLLRYLRTHTMMVFVWYRLVLSAVILFTALV